METTHDAQTVRATMTTKETTPLTPKVVAHVHIDSDDEERDQFGRIITESGEIWE